LQTQNCDDFLSLVFEFKEFNVMNAKENLSYAKSIGLRIKTAIGGLTSKKRQACYFLQPVLRIIDHLKRKRLNQIPVNRSFISGYCSDMVCGKPGLVDDKLLLAIPGDQAVIIDNPYDATIGQAGKPHAHGL